MVSSRIARHAALLLALMMGGHLAPARAAATAAGMFGGKDIVIFMTDQERTIQDVPPGWEEANLPGLTRLKRNGLTFTNCQTNACMCSPARATFLSGFFTRQHGVSFTLDQQGVMPPDQYPQVDLPTDLPGLAYAAKEAGYDVVYKGKLHVNMPTGPTSPTNPLQQFYTPYDASKLNWTRWNPPDAGGSAGFCDGGGNPLPISWPFTNGSYPGGCGNHDNRYMYDDGPVEEGKEGVLAYLRKAAAARKAGNKKPFFLVVSLVNPHDLMMYPGQAIATSGTFVNSGYNASMLEGNISPPSTIYENLAQKPTVHGTWATGYLMVSSLGGPGVGGQGGISSPQIMSNYVNFYGNLMKSSDAHLVTLLNTMDSLGFTDNAVIVRTADHGEMGLSHGRSRQKYFNMYKQTLNVMMVYSNPKLWPQPVVSDALVSHVDFVPTVATLMGTPAAAIKAAGWAGVDYSSVVAGTAKDVQDYVAFLWDDSQLVEPMYVSWVPWSTVPWIAQPNHLVAVIEKRYKAAKYFEPTGGANRLYNTEPQYEMYDTLTDPQELDNLAVPGRPLTKEQAVQLQRMKEKIGMVQRTRFHSRPGTRRLLNMSGQACTLQPNFPGTFFGGLVGQPFGNGTFTLTQGASGPMTLQVVAYMGSVEGRLKVVTSSVTGGVTTEKGVVTLTKGHGYFHDIKDAKLPYTLVRPQATALCSQLPTEAFCYDKNRCPGTFVMGAIIPY